MYLFINSELGSGVLHLGLVEAITLVLLPSYSSSPDLINTLLAILL